MSGGDDDLFVSEKSEEVLLPFQIELGEHVVEEQHGAFAGDLLDILEFGELQCQYGRSALPS